MSVVSTPHAPTAGPAATRRLGSITLGLVLGLGAGLLGAAALAWRAPVLWADLLSYGPDILALTPRHLFLVGVSAGMAVLVGIPLGILLSRPHFASVAEGVMQALNVAATVPTLAVLALAMSVLGIGLLPALFGLWLASLLPIVRNAYAGLKDVPPALLDAADGMGMSPFTRLRRVELPHARPVLFAGVRTAVTVNIGTAPLASLIGAGGYGDLIFAGIQLYDSAMMLVGALATAALALAVDLALGFIGLMSSRRLPR